MATYYHLLLGTTAILLLIISSSVVTSNGEILFSTLPKSLEVTASPDKPGQVLQAGVNKITTKWGLNTSIKLADSSSYKTIKLKLCYAPISQKDRPWRKTEDHLFKDKTCQHLLISKPYKNNNANNNTFTGVIKRDVPSGTYFVRAYAFNDQDHEVAYGESTDAMKTTNLFQVKAISGRHASLDIASAVFSAFSIVSLAWFFYVEKKKAKKVMQEG